MAELPINYGDTGKIARDKINDSFNALVEQVEWYEPHIVEWIWWIWETNTWVKAEWDNVQMKVEWDYIRYKTDSISWTTLILLSDLKGAKWDKGDKGDAFVYSDFTEEQLAALKWPQGAKWDKGDKWDKWDKGERWDTGIMWPEGKQGKQWTQWEKGDKWDKWDTGDKWPQGEQWIQGVQWETWPAGNWVESITSSKSGKITTVTITETNGDSASFQISDWQDGQWSGDVLWPNASVDWNVVLFDWTSWKYIKDSWKVIPTQASDVWALPSSTKYWASLTVSIDSDYKVTTTLKDQDGNTLGTAQVIDLPLESVVVNGSYNDQTKKIILTLQNGNTIEFSVADLVSWLQSEITSSNMLDADLVDDSTSTNKFVSASDKTAWSWKQDALIAGTNVQIASDWKTISATDTTYSASDFDIKDLADSTGLRTTWSGKQDALATQTAYTSKGSATKVPQITTNTLWQVTWITEVTITQPTVNNATLTVTQNWTSVGTFTANASSDVTIATTDTTYESKQAASSGTDVSLVTTWEKYTWNNKQDALVNQTNIKSINGNSLLGSGDLTVSGMPTGWTTGQVLMMTANWPAWVNPADNGFIMLSSSSPETLKYLWVWTETQYGNISNYDENTRYDTHD